MRTRIWRLTLLANLLFFITGNSFSEVPPECALREIASDRVVPLRGRPSYFAKTTADGKYMCYIMGRANHIVDMDQEGTEVIVPGPYDPVPVPPTGADKKVRYLTVPNSGGMSFYDMEAIEKAMVPGKVTNLSSTMKEVYRDASNMDSYQSTGVLKGGDAHGKGAVYRILSGSLEVNDYDTGPTQWKKTTPSNSCGNRGRYQLPMLSKDGKELSAYDTQEGVTKILGINPDGSCTEKLNLGMATGKVEFSYDGSAIVFHSDSYSSGNAGQQFSGVSGVMTKNVYTLEIKRDGDKIVAGALRKLTSNVKKGTGSYYPSFTQDGRVVYIQGETNASGDSDYSIHTVTPSKRNAGFLPTMVNCAPPAETAKVYALGALWTSVCSEYATQMTAADAAMWTLSLDPEACRKLVKDNWDKKKAEILSDEKITRGGKFTREDLEAVTLQNLQAACPQGTSTGPAAPKKKEVVHLRKEIGPYPVLPAKKTFEKLCLSCHNGSSAAEKFEWGKLTADQANNMLIAIESGLMPKDGEIPNREAALEPLVLELRKRDALFISKSRTAIGSGGRE